MPFELIDNINQLLATVSGAITDLLHRMPVCGSLLDVALTEETYHNDARNG